MSQMNRNAFKNQMIAALAGLLAAILVIVCAGAVYVHAYHKGSLAFVDEKGRRITGGEAEETAEEAEEPAEEIKLTEEEKNLLNETPEETEAQLEPEEPAVVFNVEKAEELVFTEGVSIRSRSGSDPFVAMGNNTDDAITLWTDPIPDLYEANDRQGIAVITPVRNQLKSNLCWAFAALGAVEANLLVKHPTLGADHLDLSEKHLAWYVMHPAQGSTGGLIDEDYREIQVMDGQSSDVVKAGLNYIMTGGVTDMVISALTAWKGPMDETGIDSFERERNGRISIKEQGNPSAPYGGAYHVQGVYMIPGAEYDREAIKKMILNYGAVTASVHADQTRGNSYWFMSNLYDGDPYGENNNLVDHEVIIVGWDDLYETDNFQPEAQHEGGWICRNSWGPTSGEQGYFWLSYDDVIYQNNPVTAYNVALEGDPDFYDKNYQVAGLLTHVTDMMIDQNNMVYALSETMNPYGVVYTAEGEETLSAVGLYALETENEYTIEIYRNPELSGELIPAGSLKEPACTQNVRSAAGGFHTYALDEPLSLSAGESFLVLVKPAQPTLLPYEKAMVSTGDANTDNEFGYVGNVYTSAQASGLSYYPTEDGTALFSQGDRDFLIKAYTKNK